MLPEAKLRQRCDGAAVTETFLKCYRVTSVTPCYRVITEMLLGSFCNTLLQRVTEMLHKKYETLYNITSETLYNVTVEMLYHVTIW